MLGGFTVLYRADRAPRRWRRSPPSFIWSAHRVWVMNASRLAFIFTADQTLNCQSHLELSWALSRTLREFWVSSNSPEQARARHRGVAGLDMFDTISFASSIGERS